MNDPVRSFRRSFYRQEHCLLVYLHLLICLPDQHGHIHAGPPTLDVIHSIVKAFSRDVVAAVHPEPVLNITIAFAVCSAADILVRVSGGVYTAQGLDNNRIHLRFQRALLAVIDHHIFLQSGNPLLMLHGAMVQHENGPQFFGHIGDRVAAGPADGGDDLMGDPPLERFRLRFAASQHKRVQARFVDSNYFPALPA